MRVRMVMLAMPPMIMTMMMAGMAIAVTMVMAIAIIMIVPVAMIAFPAMPVRIGHGQLRVCNALLGLEPAVQFAQVGHLPPHDDHLQTLLVIQMHMHVGYDIMMEVMLDIHQHDRQLAYVMVVYDNDRARHMLVRLQPRRLQQRAPRQVSESFGTVAISLLIDIAIELADQVGRKRYAEARKLFFFAHAWYMPLP